MLKPTYTPTRRNYVGNPFSGTGGFTQSVRGVQPQTRGPSAPGLPDRQYITPGPNSLRYNPDFFGGMSRNQYARATRDPDPRTSAYINQLRR